jgi:hypothetical protein
VLAVFSTLLVPSSNRACEDKRELPRREIDFYTVIRGVRQNYNHWDDRLVQLGLKTDSKAVMCSCMTDL